MFLSIAVFGLVIAGSAYFLLKADHFASNRAAAYAIAFAIVFLLGALSQQQLGRRAGMQATSDAAMQPADTLTARKTEGVGVPSPGALDTATVEGANTLYMRGWALGANGQPATKVTAIVDGIMRIDITKSYERPRSDVAAALQRSDAKNSGYEATLSLLALKRGDHRVRISVVASDGTTISFPTNSMRTFVIK